MVTAKGRCLCGAVAYAVEGPLRPIVYCHCTMCRRSTGHFLAATACAVSDLRLIGDEHLRWYDSSPEAQRGFCDRCGSNLFWRPNDGTRVSIAAGSLERPTGLRVLAHIHVADKGDYYELDDGIAQHLDGAHGVPLKIAP
ncbi:MAG: GFA family protein [Steroidobacteraceae bacterium]